LADARLPGGFAEIERSRAVQRSFHLNSSESSRDARVVDPLDLHQARELYSANIRWRTQARRTNQLTAYSVVNFKQQLSRQESGHLGRQTYAPPTHRERGARLAFGLEHAQSAPQKENQCQES